MRFIEHDLKSQGKLLVCADNILSCDIEVARLDDAQLRELIVHLKKNRPELICPIMCEDCLEHLAQVESHNQCINMRERGK
jgi:hypothetical protein